MLWCDCFVCVNGSKYADGWGDYAFSLFGDDAMLERREKGGLADWGRDVGYVFLYACSILGRCFSML